MASMESKSLPGSLVSVHSAATSGAICLLVAAICVVTRIITGQRRNHDPEDISKPKHIDVLPYYVPWLGSAISFGLRFQDFLAEAQYVPRAVPSWSSR